LRIAVIIPAYNEGNRLPAVLEAATQLPAGWELLVVDDGSRDHTAEAVQRYPRVELLRLEENRGKGAAMSAGAARTQADVLVFLDADLRGLTPQHVLELAAPVLADEAEMSIGLFRGGRGSTDFSHRISPWVSGQRAILREAFLSLEAARASRQGIELLLTRAARERGWRVRCVSWRGVTHAMKEEKLGLIPGHLARWKMYGEILKTWITGLWRTAPSPQVRAGKTPLAAPRRK
jgi:glycosyltransferase involved in cell wall biosynthesis